MANLRSARVPDALRGRAARVARKVGLRRTFAYAYEADGLATTHFSPFMQDQEFARLYAEMASEWWVDYYADVRWRMWLLTRFARQCQRLAGNFAEFGVYRAGCAFMLLATTHPTPQRKLYLFDTFEGIPAAQLSEHERLLGLEGRLADTSVEYVEQRLAAWRGRFEICAGDVLDTLPGVDTGVLAFAHLDMNASRPTAHALQYVYPRLVSGAIIVFDDYGYGWEDSRDERMTIDAFFTNKPESVIALPTGQGFVIKQ